MDGTTVGGLRRSWRHQVATGALWWTESYGSIGNCGSVSVLPTRAIVNPK